jgi:FixJ family two-component response regulator
MSNPATIGLAARAEPTLAGEGFRGPHIRVARDISGRPRRCPHRLLGVDLVMPELNGLDLKAHLKRIGKRLSIIFLTRQGDIPMSVRAIKAGAVNFLTKLVDQEEILAAVNVALAEGERDRAENESFARLGRGSNG